MTFWTLLNVKCPLENYSKPYGRATAMPSVWRLMIELSDQSSKSLACIAIKITLLIICYYQYLIWLLYLIKILLYKKEPPMRTLKAGIFKFGHTKILKKYQSSYLFYYWPTSGKLTRNIIYIVMQKEAILEKHDFEHS